MNDIKSVMIQQVISSLDTLDARYLVIIDGRTYGDGGAKPAPPPKLVAANQIELFDKPKATKAKKKVGYNRPNGSRYKAWGYHKIARAIVPSKPAFFPYPDILKSKRERIEFEEAAFAYARMVKGVRKNSGWAVNRDQVLDQKRGMYLTLLSSK